MERMAGSLRWENSKVEHSLGIIRTAPKAAAMANHAPCGRRGSRLFRRLKSELRGEETRQRSALRRAASVCTPNRPNQCGTGVPRHDGTGRTHWHSFAGPPPAESRSARRRHRERGYFKRTDRHEQSPLRYKTLAVIANSGRPPAGRGRGIGSVEVEKIGFGVTINSVLNLPELQNTIASLSLSMLRGPAGRRPGSVSV